MKKVMIKAGTRKHFLWMLVAILALCSTTTVMTSCGDDDTEDLVGTLNIVGKWRTSAQVTPPLADGMDLRIDGDIEFKADGSAVSIDADGTQTTGTWTLKDKILTMTLTIEGQTVSNTYKVQDGWTRDKMVLTYTLTVPDEGGNMVTHTVTLTMTRL